MLALHVHSEHTSQHTARAEACHSSGVGSCFPAGGLTWSEIIGAGSGPAGPAMDIHKCIYTAYQVKSRELTGQRPTYIVH